MLFPKDYYARSFKVGLSLTCSSFHPNPLGVELFTYIDSVIFRLWSPYSDYRMLIWEAFIVDKQHWGKWEDALVSQLDLLGFFGI